MRETVEVKDIPTLRAHEHWLEKLRGELKYFFPNKKTGSSGGFVDVMPSMLAFCGKAFVWYECHRKELLFDDHDSLMEFVGKEKWNYWRKEQNQSRAEWERLQLVGAIELNHLHSSPIVLVTKTKLARFSYGNRVDSTVSVTINPNLKGLGFNRYMGADQCHQEIEMFIGGVLAAKENTSNSMNDKEKILAHGMDLRWSFRNPEPPKRKRK